MKVYIAAPYPYRDAAIQVMERLEAAGEVVTSSWLKSEDQLTDAFARLDLADVDRADILVALNPPGWANTGTGGRHVEFGYALARQKPIVLVGERSHIFHHLNEVRVVDEADLVYALRSIVIEPGRLPTYVVAIQDVVAELLRAEAKFKPFNSHHEGYAVIQEEVDELWEDVKGNRKEAALKEAVQVAAMGLRYIVNLTPVAVAEEQPV